MIPILLIALSFLLTLIGWRDAFGLGFVSDWLIVGSIAFCLIFLVIALGGAA